MTEEEQTFGIPPQETTADDPGIPEEDNGIQAGIPEEDNGIPNEMSGIQDEKTTTAKVKPSTKTIVAGLKIGDESFDDTIRRIFGVYNDLTSDVEHLQKVNKEIREDLRVELERHQAKFDEQVHEIGGLRAQIATLTNQIETGLVPAGGQATLDSFGIKDTVEEARDMCGDDATCMKVAGKMLDMKAHFASKAMDNEHDAEQKRLARDHDATQRRLELDAKKETQEKDRALKKSLADKDHENKIELQLAKKGGFRQDLLDEVTFIGDGSPKHPGKVIADKKRRAYHAAADDDDESWLNDDPIDEEELIMPEEFNEDRI